MMGLKLLALVPVMLFAWFAVTAHTVGVSPQLTTAYAIIGTTISVTVAYFMLRRNPYARQRTHEAFLFTRKYGASISFFLQLLVTVYGFHVLHLQLEDNSRQQLSNRQAATVAKSASAAALQVITTVAENQVNGHRDLVHQCDYATDENRKLAFRSLHFAVISDELANDFAVQNPSASRHFHDRATFLNNDAANLKTQVPAQCKSPFTNPIEKLKQIKKEAK